MHIDDGKRTLPSKMGSLCSILLTVLLIMYAGYKISILEGKKSIDIVQAVQENHFDDTHIFTNQQGLNIAIAVFSYFNPDYQQPIDPSYGKIIFKKSQWGVDDQG